MNYAGKFTLSEGGNNLVKIVPFSNVLFRFQISKISKLDHRSVDWEG